MLDVLCYRLMPRATTIFEIITCQERWRERNQAFGQLHVLLRAPRLPHTLGHR